VSDIDAEWKQSHMTGRKGQEELIVITKTSDLCSGRATIRANSTVITDLSWANGKLIGGWPKTGDKS